MELKPRLHKTIQRGLKPFQIPKGFILIQDTNEQKPLFDSRRLGLQYPWTPPNLTIVERSIDDGDYSIDGYTHLFSVERKQMSDLMGYIGKERTARTTPKMQRFRDMINNGGWVALVIEASEEDVLKGHSLSELQPEQIRMALVSFEVRYGIRTYYNRDRRNVSRWVLDRAIKWFETQKEKESGKYY
jgi:ERCC4-type nuclease